MLVGYPPFFDSNPFGLYEKILLNKVTKNFVAFLLSSPSPPPGCLASQSGRPPRKEPSHPASSAGDDDVDDDNDENKNLMVTMMMMMVTPLVTRFFAQDANKRLGNLRNGAQDVKKHRWEKEGKRA